MKTKITYLTMALVIALSMAVGGLLVAPAPAQAATEVENVWVQFIDSAYNTKDTYAIHYIHFTPNIALSRGVDTITIWYPDGATTMGPDNFDMSGVLGTASYYQVDRDGEASDYDLVTCTTAATVSQSGYRVSITPPVDLDAGTPCSVKILAGAKVKLADEGTESFLDYKVKVYTSKDTTPVLSDAFPIDDAGPVTPALTLSPATAGLAGQWEFEFSLASRTALSAGDGKVSVIFPLGTTVPGTILADYVSFYNGSSWSTCTSAIEVNQKARTVTATTPTTLSTSGEKKIKFSTSANIVNPTIVKASGSYGDCYLYTSKDELQVVEDNPGPDVTAGTETTLGFNNDTYNSASVSDDATMVYMYTDVMYLQVWDANENLKSPDSQPVVAFESDKSGTFYNLTGSAPSWTYTQINSQQTSSGVLGISYRPAASGTHTITVSSSGYDDGTWTVYVAPGVELYDSYANLIKTYGPLSTETVKEAAGNHSGDYVEDAIHAAITGDTVKLGGSLDNIAIYEVDNNITVEQKIKVTSTNGAAYTKLRPTAADLHAIEIASLAGTATNPIIIEALTFTRLVQTGGTNVEFDSAVYNMSADYLTVTGCTFEYIRPDATAEAVVLYNHQARSITSATVSYNTFTNCGTFGSTYGNIQFYSGSYNFSFSGVNITGNIITDCNGYGIAISGHHTDYPFSASITNNILTRVFSPICLADYVSSSGASVIGNTITGGYGYAIRVESGAANSNAGDITIKKNTITDTAAVYSNTPAIKIWRVPASGKTIYVQYNTITGTNGNAIYVIPTNITSSNYTQIDCRYNWYGDATGPDYTAATGAIIAKSNPNGAGDKISDCVWYYPWLHTSLATVVADNASYQTSTVDLVAGWNTLSTPVELIPTGDTIGELIPSGLLYCFSYSGGWSPETTAYELTPCDAVYVKLSAAKTVQLKFDADERTTPSKALAVGWNMVGLAYLSSSGQEADDAVASVYLTPTNLPGYSQVLSPSMNDLRRDMYYNQGTVWVVSRAQHGDTSVSSMYATYGYWIYMLNAATYAAGTITPIAPNLD